MRVDKLLANVNVGTRKEVHELIKKGLVTVNGEVVKKKDFSFKCTDGAGDASDLSGY